MKDNNIKKYSPNFYYTIYYKVIDYYISIDHLTIKRIDSSNNNIIIPDVIDDLPVLEFNYNISFESPSLVDKIINIILPSSVVSLIQTSKNINNNLNLINLENIRFCKAYDICIPNNHNLQYSLSNISFKEDEHLEKEFYYTNEIQYKYLRLMERYDRDFYNKYYQDMIYYFDIGTYEDSNYLIEFYVYNNQAYIYKLSHDPKNTNIIIPNEVIYQNQKLKVVGLGYHILSDFQKKLNIVFNEDLEYLSFCALSQCILAIFLNNKINKLYHIADNNTVVVPDTQAEIYLTNRYMADANICCGNHKLKIYTYIDPSFDFSNNLVVTDKTIEFTDIDNHDYYKKLDDETYFINNSIELVIDKINNMEYTYYLFNHAYAILININININNNNDNISDLIIPDTVLYNHKEYPVTRINSNAVISHQIYDKVIIGKNIEVIYSQGIYIRKCHELIFKGNRIKQIFYMGLDINLNPSLENNRLVLPSSLIYLGKSFITGNIDYLSFEKDAHLLEIDKYAFDGFNRIIDLTLPPSVLFIKKLYSNTGNLHFDEGHINLMKFEINDFKEQYITFKTNNYENGKYIGTLSNPYAVCLESTGFKIHPDCYRVLNTDNIYECSKNIEYIEKANPFISSDFIVNQKHSKGVEYAGKFLGLSSERTTIEKLQESLISNDDKFINSKKYLKLKKQITKYKNGYYYGYQNNPYFILFGCEKNCEDIAVHQDCVMIFDHAFNNSFHINNIVFEKNVNNLSNLLVIGSDIFNYHYKIKELKIPSTICICKTNVNYYQIITDDEDLDDVLKVISNSKEFNHNYDLHYFINSNFINNNFINNNTVNNSQEIVKSPTRNNILSKFFGCNINFTDLSFEEYAALKIIMFEQDNLSLMNNYNLMLDNFLTYYLNLLYVDEREDEFTIEFISQSFVNGSEFLFKMIKDQNGFRTLTFDKITNDDFNQVSSYLPYLIAYLYACKQRRDQIINKYSNINQALIEFYTELPLLSLRKDDSLVECFINNKTNHQEFNYSGYQNNCFIFKIDHQEVIIQIENNIKVFCKNINLLNHTQIFNLISYLHEHLLDFLDAKYYLKNYQLNNNLNNHLNKIIINYENNYYLYYVNKLNSPISLYPILSQDIKKSKFDSVTLKTFEAGNDDKLIGKYLLFGQHNISYQYGYFVLDGDEEHLRKTLIKMIDFINPINYEHIFRNMAFNLEELNAMSDKSLAHYEEIVTAILEYQRYSEEYFINHFIEFKKAKLEFKNNVNDWAAEDKLSNKVKILTKLL